jgi:DNA-binding NtrC family response regulator
VPVDVRIATNRDLAGEMAAGRFRQDLYYRLAVVDIAIPPLRTRTEDIADLATHFMGLLSTQLGVAPLPLNRNVLNGLMHYSWPGNVRELKNYVERSLILGGFPVDALTSSGGAPSVDVAGREDSLSLTLAEVEKRHILRVLEAAGGNKSGRRKLGIADAERKCVEWVFRARPEGFNTMTLFNPLRRLLDYFRASIAPSYCFGAGAAQSIFPIIIAGLVLE